MTRARGAPNAFTIVSNNYLAFAATFCDSYLRHHPEAEVVVGIADRRDDRVDYAKLPFRVVFAEELGIPAFESFAFRYEVLELNTAIKPFMFAWLRDVAGWDEALYFDPDILICSPLPELRDALDSAPACLTPHITSPLDDEFRPSERQIRMMGVYNLGFAGFRLDDSTRKFLAWWQRRLERFCVIDPHHGIFVDQAWMDFAPAFLDEVRVLRSPRLNVAYWNLAHRELTHSGAVYSVEGEPLGFFHFSGIDVGDLTSLSKHQNRLDLRDLPQVRELFSEYRDRVLAHGHESLLSLPYGFGAFRPEAMPVPKILRRTLLRLDPLGKRFERPFDIDASDGFFRWLSEPLEFSLGRLTRAALAIWESRPDLVERYPDVVHDALPDFVRFLQEGGAAEEGVPTAMLAALQVADSPRLILAPYLQEPFRPFLHLTRETTPALLEAVDLSRPGEWLRLLAEPFPGAGERNWLTRVAMICWEKFGALQREFPDPLHRDLDDFARWFADGGKDAFDLAPELVRELRQRLPARLLSRVPRAFTFEPGKARVAAPAGPMDTATRSETGPGTVPSFGLQVMVAARTEPECAPFAAGSARALDAAGIPHSQVDLDADALGMSVDGLLAPRAGSPWPVTLTHFELRLAPWRFGWLVAGVTQGGRRIGYLDWEFGEFPAEYRERLKQWDEIWTPSAFAREVIGDGASVPVLWVPPCCGKDSDLVENRIPTGGSSGTVRILARFDAADSLQREDPWSVIEAARRLASIGPELRWQLKVKVRGLGDFDNPASAGAETLLALSESARGLPIEIDPHPSTGSELTAADIYLDLSRTGRFARAAVEAAFAGCAVAALSHGSFRDWLDEETGFPIASRAARLGRSIGPTPGSLPVVEADLDSAAESLALAIGDAAVRARRSATGRAVVSRLYGLVPVSHRYFLELERIRELLSSAGAIPVDA